MSLSLPSSSRSQALSRRSPSPGDRADSATGLEIALSQFGAILTDDERKRLQTQKSGLNDADAAFKFTLELDELDPVRRGRVVATKLCSLLQTVQSFGQVVDTYVSSHPEIAALIWGTVKLTFMVLINFTTYFQKFTDLLSGFDHLIPHFTAYEKLFPNSDRLKKSICDFHLAIVTCCTEIVNLTRLPWHEKAFAALTVSFEAKIRPSVDNIRAAANRAKDEVELARTQYDQLNHIERSKNEKTLLKRAWQSNKDLQRVKKDSEIRAKLHKWQSLLKKLPLFDYESAYRNARSKRHKGTAQWVFDTQQFQDWYQNNSSAILNVAGKIGSGKTVLTANVVDYIMSKKTEKQSISFVFVRFDDIDSQSPETIIRSLVHQTLARASVDDGLLALIEKSEALKFDYESLLDLVSHQIALLHDCFFVIDGFDECTMATQCLVLDFLSSLGQRCLSKGRIKTIISARDSVTKLVVGSLPAVSRVVVGSEETNRDLALFARAILAEKQEKECWSVRDPSLIDEILHSIGLGGEGMFLWVYLTIEDISTRRTDEHIRQALLNIPRNLPETFDRVLQRIESKGNTEIVCSVFRWTAAACYPLRLEQLSEVLNIKVNQSSAQASGYVNGINHVPTWCENLIQVEDGSETVHFCHHSIRSYLLGPTKKAILDFDLDLNACDDFVGDICLTYLHFSDFQTALTVKSPEKLDSRHLPLELPLGVVDHTLNNLGAKSHGRRIARFVKLPFGKPQPKTPFQSLPLSDINVRASTDYSSAAHQFPFLQYAKDNWCRHTLRISPSSEAWRLWLKLDVTASYAPWTNPEWQTPGIATVKHIESHRDISLASKRNLNDQDEFQVCFSLHKAIAFSDLIDHHQLLTKVVSQLIEYDLPASSQLLEKLLQPRAIENISKGNSALSGSVDSHELVIQCVTRYAARGGQRWPLNCSGDMCDTSCNTEGWKTFHRQSAQILGGLVHHHVQDPGAGFQISNQMQAQALVAITTFSDELFDRLMKRLLRKYPELETPLFAIAIERGSPWSLRSVKLLLQKKCAEPQTRHLQAAKALTRAHDIDTLEYLLENTNSNISQGLRDIHLWALMSVLDGDRPWLPKRGRERLIQLCVSSSCGTMLGEMRKVLKQVIYSTRDWDIAVALHSCIHANVPAVESAFGSNEDMESESAYTRNMADLVDSIFRCLADLSGLCKLLDVSGPHLCEEHTKKIWAMGNASKLPGEDRNWSSLRARLIEINPKVE